MTTTDDLILGLLGRVVPKLPSHIPPTVAGQERKVPDRAPEALSVRDFRARLKTAFHAAPLEFEKARNRAYRAGVAESGGTAPVQHYRDRRALKKWWSTELAKLLTMLDEGILDQQTLALHAQRILEREASTQLSRAHGEGVRAEADRKGLHRILEPERDACLICTSYAGAIAEPGGSFEVIRNFTSGTDEELPVGGVEVPVHPWCRCETRAVDLDDALVIAEPLWREAERSVLRFDALPSESDRARTEAAARLLKAGTALPKTVLQRSAREVKRRRLLEGDPLKRTTRTRTP